MEASERLLAQQCSVAVDYRALGEVGAFVRGTGLAKKDFADEGLPCIHYGQIYTRYRTAARVTESFVAPATFARLKKAAPGDLIITNTSETVEDVCTAVAWMGEEAVAFGGHSCSFSHDMDPVYLAYVFQSPNVHSQKRRLAQGTKVKEVKVSDLAKIRVPVPSLAVQRAVAAALSAMETLQDSLRDEEEARRQQFDHYRKRLMTELTEDCEWSTLGESVENKDRLRRPVTRSARVAGSYPYYGANGIQDWVNDFIYDGTHLLVGEDGTVITSKGTPVLHWVDGKVWVNNHAHVLGQRDGGPNLRFLYHYLGTYQVAAKVTGAAQPKINQKNLNSIPVPLPPMDVQRSTAERLDVMHGLIESLAEERSARQQQFEHYRDQLLTFPERPLPHDVPTGK